MNGENSDRNPDKSDNNERKPMAPAINNPFDVCKFQQLALFLTFNLLALDELVEFVEKYRQRKYDEELTYLQEDLGGVEEVARKLKTDLNKGITAFTEEELDERDMIFGTNKKKVFKRTSKISNSNLQAFSNFSGKLLMI